LLTAVEGDEEAAVGGGDVVDVPGPRRRGAGRGLVVEVAACWSGCRSRQVDDHSAVSSVTAARAEDSSTMALSVANPATRACGARLLTARGSRSWSGGSGWRRRRRTAGRSGRRVAGGGAGSFVDHQYRGAAACGHLFDRERVEGPRDQGWREAPAGARWCFIRANSECYNPTRANPRWGQNQEEQWGQFRVLQPGHINGRVRRHGVEVQGV